MAPSQLKQLKTTLREHGFIGLPQSKKQKKRTSKNDTSRIQRNSALAGIRERFNPFEVKLAVRKDKFDVVSNKVEKNTSQGRPGVTKGLGEERRRATLLKEIQSRNKVGGILDRRFGEDDPTMTPEQRAAERFARQSEKRLKQNSMFNLEDEDDDEIQLTHGGLSLAFGNGNWRDDSRNEDLENSGEHDDEDIDDRPRKRLRLSDDDRSDEEGEHSVTDVEKQLPERRKTKQEVMKEVIAKSKLYKHERQQAKEDDDNLRAELDKGLPDFHKAMQDYRRGPAPQPVPVQIAMNPDRAALLAGTDRDDADKEYNERVREMALDARSKPSERTKTEEEKAAEEAQRLQELERKRLLRMRGESESSAEELPDKETDEDAEQDDAKAFGLDQRLERVQARPELGVEEEDDFVYDDIVASESEASMANDDQSSISEQEEVVEDDGDDDFINGLVLPELRSGQKQNLSRSSNGPVHGDVAFTYPCPESHAQFLQITEGIGIANLPIVVQRIRALHHPQLAEGNKAKLERLCAVLVEHVAYFMDQMTQPPFIVLDSLLRHIHSLAKSHPGAVSTAFRAHLRLISQHRPLALQPSDLVILTGISTIFPTSDHFHSVVTPANLTLARYLGQSSVGSLNDLAKGAYCCSLALQYQRLSRRYMPEVMTYAVNALSSLCPIRRSSAEYLAPSRRPKVGLRIEGQVLQGSRLLKFSDLANHLEGDSVKLSLIHNFTQLVSHAAGLWQSKLAFNEIFQPMILILEHLVSKRCKQFFHDSDTAIFGKVLTELQRFCEESISDRRPLLLHNHRPLAIKTSIPKFEESYNPDRHYDPDRERSELNKLKAEHKRERKGAIRELRKDANFIARESLREKKEKDDAYEKKFKRLVAEIQGEEGKEAKEYEKEKRKRRGKW